MADQHTTVAYQVMWNRLISVVEEQAQALVRTAFSTSVREAGDLSAGVYDVQGRMLAQAVTGTPGHVNAMADAVAHFIRRIGRDNILEGDVYLTNDPWEGTGHLHDVTMVSPSFLDDRLVGFFACTAHVVDIGGRGFGADGASVYEEGLYIPIMKFADRGTVDETLVRIVRGNVREPGQLIGDLYALASCNEIGHLGKQALLRGDHAKLGSLMNENHALQRDLGGSGESNEALISAALGAGALGAKLAGAGDGGTVVLLWPGADIAPLEGAVREAGASQLWRPRASEGVVVE